jgi:hypothetical protein
MRGVTLFEFLFGMPFLGMLMGLSVVSVEAVQARYERGQAVPVASKATRQRADLSSLAAATAGHQSVTQVP